MDYFLARYYSSAQGRFTSPDPLIYAATRPGDPQQFNLFGYVRNNPLALTDPDGKDLTGSSGAPGAALNQADQEALQRRLHQLSPGSRVDAQGHVHKSSFFRRIWNHLSGHGHGTSLISRLVDSRQTTNIVIMNGTNNASARPTNPVNASNGVGSNVVVEYDPNINVAVPTRTPDASGHITATSPIQDEAADPAVVLGHELSHADHMTRGTRNVGLGDHDFLEGNITYREAWREEELRTTGFAPYVRRGDITENQLRRELNQRPRAAYTFRPQWLQIHP